MRAARRHDWYTHYQICKMHGDHELAEKYAANLRGKFKTADRELAKIDRAIVKAKEIEKEMKEEDMEAASHFYCVRCNLPLTSCHDHAQLEEGDVCQRCLNAEHTDKPLVPELKNTPVDNLPRAVEIASEAGEVISIKYDSHHPMDRFLFQALVRKSHLTLGVEYVVWLINTEDGGRHIGYYSPSLDRASAEFTKRGI